MDFDTDDPLGDLLSEGSNDSFFEEPKVSMKRGSLPKTPETKSISDLFGLNDDKKIEQTKSTDDWLGLGNKTSQIAQTQNKTVKKISFEDDDDILNNLGLEKKSDIQMTEKVSDVLTPAKLEPSKKSALLESILGTPKKAVEKTPMKLENKPEPQTTNVQKSVESSYGFSSLDAPREGRRRPASGIKDPLGLFAAESQTDNEKKQDVTKSIQASPLKKRDVSKTPDWLNQSSGAVGDGGSATSRTEVLFPIKGDLKTKSVPNLTNLPDWLSNEPIKSHKSETTINKNNNNDEPEVRFIEKSDGENPSLQSLLTQQKLTTSHVEYQNTAMALQQQESQILMTLQLKKYEENLLEMQRKQQDVLVRQEHQFNSLLERQFAKQQMLENKMRLQQERINNHIEMLISQPSMVTTQSSTTEDTIAKTEELKKINAEETVKLYENIIESLKQRHHEELFLIEESYKKQFSTMEQSAEAVEKRLKAEINELKRENLEKHEHLKKENELEVENYHKKVDDLTKRHILEISQLRESHERIIEEMKYEYNMMIENIKQAKQSENNILENVTTSVTSLDKNVQILGLNTKILEELKGKMEKDYGVLSMAREESIKAKEEEIRLMRITLDKARESTEMDRSQLMSLIRNLEMKLVEQVQNAKEERWAMQQAAASLAARSAALDRETEFNRKSLEFERDQIKTLKETLLAEQERTILQLTEEKLSLSAERSKLETSVKLNQNYETQKAKVEIEAAIQMAKEAAEMTDKEREQLHRKQSEIELLKRSLVDRQRKLEQKEIELTFAIKNAEKRAKEGERALNEAKSLETNNNERLRSIQSQLINLTHREKRLSEEKIALSKERLAFNNSIRLRKKCGLCAVSEVEVLKTVEDDAVVEQDQTNISHVINAELSNLREELRQTRRKFSESVSE